MGQLFVVTGPSGAGKREVLERSTQMGFDFSQLLAIQLEIKERKKSKARIISIFFEKTFKT